MKKPPMLRRLILQRRIVKYLKPYLENKNAGLSSFHVVNSVPSLALSGLIDALKKYPSEYEKELASFEDIQVRIAAHNKEVTELSSYQFKNGLKVVLGNPLPYNEDDFREDCKVAQALKKYTDVDEGLNAKADEIIKLVDNLSLIKEEYLLHETYLAIASLKDAYYDSKMAKAIQDKFSPIKNQMGGKERFYDFSLLDEACFESYIATHNEAFVDNHLKDPIFDDVNGKSLDEEQRKAVLRDEASSLTIAGAGSGKTLTICGKLKYLLSQGIKPEEILLLSYSKKSADDLARKAKGIDPGFAAGTFHKIGLEILQESESKRFMVEDQFSAIVERYFNEELFDDKVALKDVLRYYAFYLNCDGRMGKFGDKGSLYEDLKKKDLRTLRDVLSKGTLGKKLITYKKEYVKSEQELAIANFYFLNGIDYVYEMPYEANVDDHEHRQYTPDFYLKDYGIYHEHYGIDRNGEANQFEGEEALSYVEGIAWKRKIHEEHETVCLETYSYDFSEGKIYERLTALLKEHGVKFHPLKEEDIKEAVETIDEGKPFRSFLNLIKSFLSLYKARYQDETYFKKLKETQFKDAYQKERASLFLSICERIYLYYEDYLKKEGKIDFDDMILQSKEKVSSLPNFKYRYIIVDEFQDISCSRMEFLKALIRHGDSKLFAVGDDWQAIYRFSGCDLGLFLNFERYFGKSAVSYITSTHRNSQELQDIAGPFIKENPSQINKTIHSVKHLDKPVKLVYFEGYKRDAFLQALSLISEKDKKANILVLSRNNKDLEEILDDDLSLKSSFESGRNSVLVSKEYPDLNIHCSTAHGSKGLEEDYVILINADDARLGFPNKMEDDSLLDLVLSETDQTEYGEERRLWYVALTRTRGYCYILVDAKRPSSFVKEIEEKCEIINEEIAMEENAPLLCPHCGSGHLILRKNSRGQNFYGCSNYPYCDYAIADTKAAEANIRCPVCNDFLIKRKGRYGSFYGCHSYPRCFYKRDIRR